jgi:hypothetical protein
LRPFGSGTLFTQGECAYSEFESKGSASPYGNHTGKSSGRNRLTEQDRKQRRGDNRRDSTIVIIGLLTIMAAVGLAITALMG